MATGIVGNAAELVGLSPVAAALFYVNLIAYPVLVLLLGARVVWHRARVLEDLTTHARGPGLLTTVAGTAVFGSQWLLVFEQHGVARVLWVAALLLWLLLVYTLFARLTLAERKPPIDQGLNGTWMLFVVAPQSVSVLGLLLAPRVGWNLEGLLGVCLVLHLLGGVFYVLLITLILYRFLFFPFDPERLHPPYWINMGAVAITTLAGSLLILRSELWTFLAGILPFLKGSTLLFWSVATWWIPLLVVLGIWRHGFKRLALRYDVQYWSIVFPLGMYSVATFRLSAALHWPGLGPWSISMAFVALAAWCITTIGLGRALPRVLRTG
jgi:tellurite resistance protein TehA-like permease